VGAVVTLMLIAAGFLLATIVVIALARTSTAHWEREKRAPVAPRRGVIAAVTSDAEEPAPLPRAVLRRVVAATREHDSLAAPVTAAAGILTTAGKQVASHVRPVSRVPGVLRSWLSGAAVGGAESVTDRPTTAAVPDDTTIRPVVIDPDQSPLALVGRSDATPGTAGHGLFRRTSRRPHRRLRGLLQRHDHSEEPPVLPADSDDSAATR